MRDIVRGTSTVRGFKMRVAIVTAISIALLPVLSSADVPSEEHAVIARSSGDVLLLWDAGSAISSVGLTRLSEVEAMSRIKREAIRVLASSKNTISRKAVSVTLQVLFTRSGAVSAAYGTATFAGVEHYARIRMSGSDFFSNRSHWQELKDSEPVPRWLTFDVTGKLPPRGDRP